MPTQTIDKLLLDLHVLTGIPVRLYDEKQRGLLSYSEHQPLCLFTHSSECKSDAARLIAHCYAFDDACFEGAKRTGDVFMQYCPLGFYSATCPIYDSERLLGFLQFSDILCDSEAARQNTRALALSYPVTAHAKHAKPVTAACTRGIGSPVAMRSS